MLRLAILPRPPGPLNPGMPTSLGPKRELQDACEYKCSAVFKLPAKVHTDTWACPLQQAGQFAVLLLPLLMPALGHVSFVQVVRVFCLF